MMFQPDGGPIVGKPIWVTTDLSDEGDEAIKSEIRSVMDGCKIALFVIGQNVHNSPWVNYELAYAMSPLRIPCFGIINPHILFGPPNIFRNIEILNWKPREIAQVLNKIL